MKKQTLLLSFLVVGFLVPALVLASDAPVTPFKAKGQVRVIGIQWADPAAPLGGATSNFEGRCSVPSDYVITMAIVGEAAHLGRLSVATAQHCSQIMWTQAGPAGAEYSDGRFMMQAANGDILAGTYTDGTSGVDENGLLWYHDFWTITEGTGRFLKATGSGEEGGTFSDLFAFLSGAQATWWAKGNIAYRASDRR
jgi:hypothetical protein